MRSQKRKEKRYRFNMKRERSGIWHLYSLKLKNNRLDMVCCKVCDREIKYLNNTSNMRLHSKVKHTELFEKVDNKSLQQVLKEALVGFKDFKVTDEDGVHLDVVATISVKPFQVLTEDHKNVILEKIGDMIDTAVSEELEDMPKFRGIPYLTEEGLKICCNDLNTAIWLEECVKEIKSPIPGSKLVLRTEKGKPKLLVPCKLFIPFKDNLEKIKYMLENQNKSYDVGIWKLKCYEETDMGKFIIATIPCYEIPRGEREMKVFYSYIQTTLHILDEEVDTPWSSPEAREVCNNGISEGAASNPVLEMAGASKQGLSSDSALHIPQIPVESIPSAENFQDYSNLLDVAAEILEPSTEGIEDVIRPSAEPMELSELPASTAFIQGTAGPSQQQMLSSDSVSYNIPETLVNSIPWDESLQDNELFKSLWDPSPKAMEGVISPSTELTEISRGIQEMADSQFLPSHSVIPETSVPWTESVQKSSDLMSVSNLEGPLASISVGENENICIDTTNQTPSTTTSFFQYQSVTYDDAGQPIFLYVLN